MANHKSTKKQILNTARNRQRNMSVTSRMKTFMKQAEEALDSKDAEKVKAAVPVALSEIDRAASKGVIHPNAAGRKKSHLQRRVASIAE